MNDAAVYQAPPELPSYLPMTPAKDAHIAALRWEPDEIIDNLVKRLGFYDMLTDPNTGERRFFRPPNVRPLVNDMGLNAIVGLVQGWVSPVTSLSNWDDMLTNNMIASQLDNLIFLLVENRERYEIEHGDLYVIKGILYSLCVGQFHRAKEGHETRASNKTEIRLDNTSTPPPQQSRGFFPSLGGR